MSLACTAVIGLIVFASAIEPPDLLVWINLFAFGGLEAVFLWPIILGLYWKEANASGAVASIVAGVAEGCVQAGAALVGGETAEMPGFYPEQEYDLAGFTVGVVEKSKIIDNTKMQAGDAVIALPLQRRALQRLFSCAQDIQCGVRGYLASITTSFPARWAKRCSRPQKFTSSPCWR